MEKEYKIENNSKETKARIKIKRRRKRGSKINTENGNEEDNTKEKNGS